MDLALVLVGVVVDDLVGLRESVVEDHARSVVSVTAEVGLGTLLLLNFHCHDLNLVVGKTDLHFELVWHDELVSLNRVIVVLLLLLLLLLLFIVSVRLLVVRVVIIHVLVHLKAFEFKQ